LVINENAKQLSLMELITIVDTTVITVIVTQVPCYRW